MFVFTCDKCEINHYIFCSEYKVLPHKFPLPEMKINVIIVIVTLKFLPEMYRTSEKIMSLVCDALKERYVQSYGFLFLPLAYGPN